MKSCVGKALDSAVGYENNILPSTKKKLKKSKTDLKTRTEQINYRTSFDDHVIGGYKFLMRFYTPGDDIYMFGFSRGAYTARFLAEMLDHVGLVAKGNEEMVLFAWKTFSAWMMRRDNTKKEMFYKFVFRLTCFCLLFL
jgi:uncharacterized protein (DUF2235 family)